MRNDSVMALLHNAARKYCIDRADELAEIHKQSDTDEEKQEQGAGISLLIAILLEIERAVPKDFDSGDEAHEYLLMAGKKAQVLGYHTEGSGDGRRVVSRAYNWTETERKALESARADYITYVTDLSLEKAASVERVPYRHVLTGAKRFRVAWKLEERWGVSPREHYWYPLLDVEIPSDVDVLALQELWFYKEVGAERMRSILLARGITRIWELQESIISSEYELDPRLCSFWGNETYWSSPELDWLVYVSHESSITFAGTWLVDAIKKSWPNWQQRIYTGYDYEPPPG